MKMDSTTPNQTKPRMGRARRVMLVTALFALLAIGTWTNVGCLPSPTAFQIQNLQACGNLGGSTSISLGYMDVTARTKVGFGYILGFQLLNMLGSTSDPAQFRPETNYIQVSEIKIWFEYPANFSLNGGGAALYPESAPKVRKIHFRIAPTTIVDFAGAQQQQGAGAQGGVQVAANPIEMEVVPIETLALWANAAELKASPNVFQVLIHASFTGTTLTGSVLSTQEVHFPINVCNGCLDASNANSTCALAGAGIAGGTDLKCAGQDFACLPDPTAQNP